MTLKKVGSITATLATLVALTLTSGFTVLTEYADEREVQAEYDW
jgi:UDP-N-acetylglucosamine enolpyruvyl transferase